jgi:preprotein translocase subunit YajC
MGERSPHPGSLAGAERIRMLTTLILFAQDAAQQTSETPGSSPASSPLFTFMPLILIFGLFWYLMIRPMRKQEAQRKALLASLEKNDKVLTRGGIFGTVVSVGDKDDEVVVRIDDNVKVRMTKSAIDQNLTKQEALANQRAKK